MAANAALRGNAPVLFFSSKGRLELFLRLVCSDAMPIPKIQKGFLENLKKVLLKWRL